MKSIRFSSTLALVLISCIGFAQNTPEPPAPAIAPVPPIHGKGESIIIHKNGDSKEKLTIVIDGDNITINGKPAKDFKNGDVEVIRNRGWDPGSYALISPNGGPKAFSRSFNMHDNDAVLGVMPIDGDNGAKLNEVTKGSAADKAGLKEGDVITKINDQKVEDADDLVDAISKYKPNDKVTITYMRDKKQNTTTATLDKNKGHTFVWNGNDSDFNMFKFKDGNDFNFMWNDKPRLGLRVQDTENGQGVTVKDIDDDDSPAAKAGLKEDDVITAVNGKAVQSVKDIKDQLKDLKQGDDVKLTYKRNGTTQTATVHIPKPLQTSDL
jgi:serine protease Do